MKFCISLLAIGVIVSTMAGEETVELDALAKTYWRNIASGFAAKKYPVVLIWSKDGFVFVVVASIYLNDMRVGSRFHLAPTRKDLQTENIAMEQMTFKNLISKIDNVGDFIIYSGKITDKVKFSSTIFVPPAFPFKLVPRENVMNFLQRAKKGQLVISSFDYEHGNTLVTTPIEEIKMVGQNMEVIVITDGNVAHLQSGCGVYIVDGKVGEEVFENGLIGFIKVSTQKWIEIEVIDAEFYNILNDYITQKAIKEKQRRRM